MEWIQPQQSDVDFKRHMQQLDSLVTEVVRAMSTLEPLASSMPILAAVEWLEASTRLLSECKAKLRYTQTVMALDTPILRKGVYRTKGGSIARIDRDITKIGTGVVREVGFVAYTATGEFAYKDEPDFAEIGDSLDLIVEREE